MTTPDCTLTWPNKINWLVIECDWEASYSFGNARQSLRELWGALEIRRNQQHPQALVECFLSNWRELRDSVRRAEKFIPTWLRG